MSRFRCNNPPQRDRKLISSTKSLLDYRPLRFTGFDAAKWDLTDIEVKINETYKVCFLGYRWKFEFSLVLLSERESKNARYIVMQNYFVFC